VLRFCQFAAGGIGDDLEIADAPVAERARLSGDFGKPENPQYLEIAQACPLPFSYIDGNGLQDFCGTRRVNLEIYGLVWR
jgi:hypothetical protein